MAATGDIVIIDGKEYIYLDSTHCYLIQDGEYHLIATYGLARKIGGMDPGDYENKIITVDYVSEASCAIRDIPVLGVDYYTDGSQCVLYDDLIKDDDISIDGDETDWSSSRFRYKTNTGNIVTPYGTTDWIESNEAGSPWNSIKTIWRGGGGTIPANAFNPTYCPAADTLTEIKAQYNPSFGDSCFQGCSNLERITIFGQSNGDTVNIGKSAFADCSKLRTVLFGSYWYDSLDDKVNIDNNAFKNCINLENLIGQDNIKTIGSEAFRHCDGLTTLTLVNCTSLGAMAFGNCANLERVILYCNATLNNEYGGLFYNCPKLNEIVVYEDGQGVRNAAGFKDLFDDVWSMLSSEGKAKLKIKIPSQYQSFYRKTSAGWNSHIVNMDYDVVLASTNDTLYINDTYNAKGVIETAMAFGWLKYNTRTLTIFEAEKITSINIMNGTIKNNLIFGDGDEVEYDANKKYILKDFSAFFGFYNAKTIETSCFEKLNELKYIHFPNSIETIEDSGFTNCYELEMVSCGENLKTIGRSAFENCDKLWYLSMRDNIEYIGNNAFSGCTSLTSITIPDSVTNMGENVFYDCTGLSSATIGNGITKINDNTFNQCYSLSSVTIGSGVTSIGSSAFSGCTGLTSIVIPDSVTSIGNEAFYGCSGLTSVTIGSGVTSIGDSAFYDCSGLTSIVIPDSVTSIGDSAFYGLTSVSSITIPDSVTSIGQYAFYNVQHIEYHGSATGSPWGAKSIN